MTLSRILSRDEVSRLRDADRILLGAERSRLESVAEAARVGQDMLDEARLKALKESTRTAARLIAKAEAAAEARLQNIEPELARLVAQTVRSILGSFEPEEASYLAALNALSQLRDQRRGRIFAAADTLAPVRRAVEALGESGPEILSITADPAFEPGRAVLTSFSGSTEIGLGALTARALAPWEDEGEP
ncbi:type III secretion system protein [Paracoccus aminophilus]|uniref:Type III secretion system protein n=1 Tax=Paracoccus aminophilus JCM 7686 TaxID=1367847 RepID=S5XZK9_PARAH|nr:type III secretion system protein [Paracoccus aminophilus]AGT08880.1 type III secretion system protein [Paracoccus aminophilus JCM 7686]